MADALGYLAFLISLAAAGQKLLAVGRTRPRNPSQCYLAAAILTVGVSLALGTPSALRTAARIEPLPNLTRLVANALAMIAGWCVLAMLAHALGHPERLRRRLLTQVAVLVAAVAAMAGLLLAAHTRFTVEFLDTYAAAPLIIGYEIAYVGYMAWAMASFIWLVRHYLRQAEQPWLRVGLEVVTVGASVGLVWAGWKIANTVLAATGPAALPVEGPVAEALAAGCVALVAAGSTMTTWAPSLAAPVRRWRVRRAYRAVTPLWTALCRAVPEIALPAPDDDTRGDLEFGLYRRIIEIRDGSLALAAHRHPRVPEWAARAVRPRRARAAERGAAIVEAAVLAAAIDAKAAGRRFPDRPAARPGHPVAPHVAAETAWLVRVSRAFARSPVVAAVRARAGADDAPARKA